jgi:hypothetical protein
MKEGLKFMKKRYFRGFWLILASLIFAMLVMADEVSQPSDLRILDGNETIVLKEGSQVVVDLEVNFTGPVSVATLLEGSIGNESESELLIDMLNYQGINYVTVDSSYSVSNSTDVANLVFSEKGEQIVYILVGSPDDEFDELQMDIVGSASGSNYPVFPSLDFGADGSVEWQYFGDFVDFRSDYSEPEGLNEGQGGKEIIIKNTTKSYFCEVIDLPYGRDFEIYANVKKDFTGDGPVMLATILQLSSPSSKVAYGGSDVCNLDVGSGGNNFEYYNCELDSSYAIKGEYLICVYNNESDGEYEGKVNLKQDDSGEDAYVCEESGSDYSCEKHTGGDFLIKIKGAEYTEVLKGKADFKDGLINNYDFFIQSLSNSIANCEEITEGSTGCVVPVKVKSESSGILGLQNLDMSYTSDGVEYHAENFYLNFEIGTGLIGKIGDVSLFDINESEAIGFSTLGLFLPAPDVDSKKKYDLNISLRGGPSDEIEVYVEPYGGGGYNESSAKKMVNEYISFFNDLKTNSGALLDLFALNADVDGVLTDLKGYLAEIAVIGGMNLTESERGEKLENFTKGLTDELDLLVQVLPKNVRIIDRVEDVTIAQPSDVLIDMVGSEEERMIIYYHQEDFTINAVAEFVEVEFFDETVVSGTIVTKSLKGRGSDYIVYESVPNYIATVNEIMFDEFSLAKSGDVNLYMKDYSSLEGVEYSYFVNGNIIVGLSDMKTVLVPKAGVSIMGSDEVPICGDGKCAVFLVEGEKIYLEDEVSCPEDCASKVNWSGIFMIFMMGLLVIVAVAIYLKFFGGGKNKIKSKGAVDKAMLFSNPDDEKSLKDYIVKATGSGIAKEKTVDVLLKRGWNKEQIDYIFNSINKK